jgi:hypothetical protein
MAIACHSNRASTLPPRAAHAELSRYDDSTWQWVEAECSDGDLELGRVGLDRQLTLQSDDQGALTLIVETELATEGCYASAEWLATVSADAGFHFEPRALLSLPPDVECGAVDREPVQGSLRIRGDELEMITHGSAWCRGFDARFVYRRAESRRLSPRQVVTRYVGAFNRRDPKALAALFVDGGSLIEPFTRTDDGNYKRHEGRRAVEGWFAAAFASSPWSAMRLEAITKGREEGHVIADWKYMDARLEAPLRGRNLFVIAGGEIYETEVQLVEDPQPLRARASAAAASQGSTPPRVAPSVAP